MKLFLFALLIVLAFAQHPDCKGYADTYVCYHPTISGCVTYTDPATCSKCLDGYEVSSVLTTSGYSQCVASTAYAYLTNFKYTAGQTEKSHLCKNIHYNNLLPSTYKYAYTQLGCVIDGQQVCQSCISGYRYDTKTFLCVACSDTKCLTCTRGATETKDTCTECLANKFLLAGVCTDCPTNAATCTSATVVTKCNAGYFLAADGKTCSECGGKSLALTCTDVKTDKTCVNGAYLDSTTTTGTSVCVACNVANTGTCTAKDAAGIEYCKVPSDGTKAYFKTGSGSTTACSEFDATYMCKTGKLDTATPYCDTCPSGWARDLKQCYAYGTSKFVDTAVGTTYADRLLALTDKKATSSTSFSTAATFTCASGYYKESTTGKTPAGVCRKCTNTDANCPTTCQVDSTTATNAPQCIAIGTFTDRAWIALTANSAATSCAGSALFGDKCARCNAEGCTEVTTADIATNVIVWKKQTTGTGSPKKMAMPHATLVTTFKTGSSATFGDYSKQSAGAVGTAMSAAVGFSTTCATVSADDFTCTSCASTNVMFKKYTDNTWATLTNAFGWDCIIPGAATTDLKHATNYANCLTAYATSTGEWSTGKEAKCLSCIGDFLLASDKCNTAITNAITGCYQYTSQTVCAVCTVGTHLPNTGATKCLTVQTGCKTYKVQTSQDDTTVAKCSEVYFPIVAQDNTKKYYSMKASGLTVTECGSATYANCDISSAANMVVADTASACTCVKCLAGYYLSSGACVSTLKDNCMYLDTTITADFKCLVCDYGYKAVAGVCTDCAVAATGCVHTGCENKEYPGKAGSGGSGSKTSGSSIISFLLIALCALMTFMI